MNSNLVSKENNKAIFNVEVPYDRFEKAVQEAYLKSRKGFSMPGFRKGRVPRKIIEMNYGEGIFFEEAINILLPEVYGKSVEELELFPVSNPEIDIEKLEKGSDVVFKFEVDIKPEITLGDYSNLKAEVNEYKVTEEHIENVINNSLESNARLVTVEDRKTENGDIVNIDFLGRVDGEKFEGGEAKGFELTLGSDTFIPGFEPQLVGKELGEELEVTVTFPEDYHEVALAGKETVFEVKINGIQEKIKPELDDEFVKDISEFDTVEEYKNNIKEDLEEQFETRTKAEKENNAIEALIEATEMEIPESMFENEVEEQFNQFVQRIQSMGLTLEQYFEITGANEETTKEELRVGSELKVKADLVIEALAKAEDMEVSEEEIDEELGKLADQYDPNNKEKFVENMKKGDLGFIEDNIKRIKAVDKLVDMVEFEIKAEEKDAE